MRKNRKAQGFTLIELLIVIAIIGILAAVLIPNLLSARTRGVLTAGTNYARETLVALESMQSANSTVDYAATTTAQNFVTGGARAATVSLAAPGAATNPVSFTVADFLRAPTQNIQEVDFYPNGGAGFIEVEQTIGTDDWCTELAITGNVLRQTKAVCNGTLP